MTKPQPGTVWANNQDWQQGRTIRIDRLEVHHAICRILTNSHRDQTALDNGTSQTDQRGRTTRIQLKRFDADPANPTGYRPITENQ